MIKTNSDPYKGQIKEYLKLVAVKKGISMSEVARMSGQSVQNLHGKLTNGSLKASELFMIADLLGASVHFIDKRTGKQII